MRLPSVWLLAAAAALRSVVALPADASCFQPTVHLPQGTVKGMVDDSYQLDQFLGIPYAKPPVGDLRFARPQPVDASDALIDASQFGDVCMQPPAGFNMSEDCLNLNVIRPKGVAAGAKLPVLVWIYGGAFFAGSTPAYNASELVARSAQMGKPIVFVAISYRVGPFGFLGGKEIVADGTPNAGLYDQRLALKWVQHNIARFGGDAGRVTIFGQSAGAMSVALQTFAYDGNTHGLFHAAIMDSGGIAPGPLLTPHHPTVQSTFEQLAKGVGCTQAPLLECLRSANASAVQSTAMQLTAKAGGTFPIPGALAFLPLVDYALITDYPSVNLAQGKLADIPVISGNALDEGTLFAQKALNSSADFETWVRSAAVIYNTTYTERALQRVFEVYPDDPVQGSPYPNEGTNTSAATQDVGSRMYPPLESNQYKRSAAFFGDFTFNAHRRTYLHAAVGAARKNSRNVWSFEFRQNDMYPNGTGSALGAYHGSELKYLFIRPDGRQKDPQLEEQMPRSYVSFTYYHDPSRLSSLPWTRYTTGEVLQLKGGNVTTVPDTFRKEAMHALTNPSAAAVFGF
ncbi:hypothetical protein PaG_01714 [Moesziomyces aphidis]|uniref:Carboxylic ester hydrolase n=1 Tax=Moesziomyces aphidis TaxID=84754 RepID=W3VRL5_MOEAP|nr:hypothetical protein PaG_01714 [Moesziomyces aphidis]